MSPGRQSSDREAGRTTGDIGTGPRFIYLHGLRIRTGTNYLARIMMGHPDVRVVPPEGPTNEFPLLKTLPEWERVFERVRRRLFGRHPAPGWPQFAGRLGRVWEEMIAEHYGIESGAVFLKDPHVTRIEEFFDVFPRARLILLIRDGRDNVASSVRAGMLVRRTMSRGGVLRRRVRHWVMKDFVDHSRHWAWSARQVLEFDARHRGGVRSGQYMILRYENLVADPRATGAALFQFMGLSAEPEILDRIEETRVVGSSFYGPEGREDATRPNWTPTEKTESFRPVGRWAGWGPVRKRAFKRLAGRELIALEYAEDLRW